MLPKNFSIISGKTEHIDRTEGLANLLRDRAIEFFVVDGLYNGVPETSLLIPHDRDLTETVDALGRAYEQEAVIHSIDGVNELRFSDGRPSLIGHGVEIGKNFNDFYSVLNGVKFRLVIS